MGLEFLITDMQSMAVAVRPLVKPTRASKYLVDATGTCHAPQLEGITRRHRRPNNPQPEQGSARFGFLIQSRSYALPSTSAQAFGGQYMYIAVIKAGAIAKFVAIVTLQGNDRSPKPPAFYSTP